MTPQVTSEKPVATQSNPPVSLPQQVPCRYTMGKILGKGTYSVVREAIHTETGQ